MKSLRERIDLFLEKYHMAPSRLGLLARNDPAFVFRLRKGRRVHASTVAAVEAWMREYEERVERDLQRNAGPDRSRVLVIDPTPGAPAELHVYRDGDTKPTVVPLTPGRCLTLSGDLLRTGHRLLNDGMTLTEAKR